MKKVALLMLLGACTNDGSPPDTNTNAHKSPVELCGQPPAEPDPDYHYWAAYQTYPNDPSRYAILHEINWKWMVDYADALQVWRDCVVGLD